MKSGTRCVQIQFCCVRNLELARVAKICPLFALLFFCLGVMVVLRPMLTGHEKTETKNILFLFSRLLRPYGLIFCDKTKYFLVALALITRSPTKSHIDFVAPTKNNLHKLHSRFRQICVGLNRCWYEVLL